MRSKMLTLASLILAVATVPAFALPGIPGPGSAGTGGHAGTAPALALPGIPGPGSAGTGGHGR
jgi:hypothetical protein